MSKNSSESEMVQNEITRARDLEKQIFPLLLDGKNWLVVQSRQFVDVRDGSLPSERFYKRLEAVTPRKKDTTDLPPPPIQVRWRPSKMVIGFSGIILAIVVISLLAFNGPSFLVSTATASLTSTIRPSATFTSFVQTSTKTVVPISTLTTTYTPSSTATLTPTRTFTPTPVVILDDNVSMVLIPRGAFNKYDRERGHIKITLPDFYIDQHEVTNAQYQICFDAGICGEPHTAGSEFKNVEHFGDNRYSDYPVILVSYNRAKTYCEWRGTRLPTGSEWEKAARGLLAEQTYPWGDIPPSCEFNAINGTNYSGCNSNDAFPVMSFMPNGYGLFDMSGNVAEWVDEGNKLIRGGSWLDNESRIKVYSTVEGETFNGYVNVGFRCAKDAP